MRSGAFRIHGLLLQTSRNRSTLSVLWRSRSGALTSREAKSDIITPSGIPTADKRRQQPGLWYRKIGKI